MPRNKEPHREPHHKEPRDEPEQAASAGPPKHFTGLRVVLLVAAAVLLVAVGGLLAAEQMLSSPSASPAPAAHGDDPSASPAATDARTPPQEAAAAAPTPTPPAPPTPTLEPARPSPTPVEPDNRFALLLLGYGGGGHEGGYLTDAMMVVIGDPDRKTLTLLSLPRDVWAPLDFEGGRPVYNKLNTAYAFARDSHLYPRRLPRYQGSQGAGTFTKETVSELLGIPIESYLALDFDGFRRVIDAAGGVDVDVPSSFTAQYPRNDDPSIDPGWRLVRFTAGRQHMNGARALEFTRARLSVDNPAEGNDFARARRQRLVLDALKQRLLQPEGLLRLPQILAIAQRSADTDYPLPAVADLARLAASGGDVRLYQVSLSLSNYMTEGTGPSGEYILLPKSSGASWAAVRAFSQHLWADPGLGQALADTTVVLVNRSGESALSATAADRLSASGYVVGSATRAPFRAQTVVRDRCGGRAGPLLAELTRELGLSGVEVVVEENGPSPQVVVELGQDAVRPITAAVSERDSDAPTSAGGVRQFGRWVAPAQMVVAAPTPTPAPDGAPRTAPAPSGKPAELTPTPSEHALQARPSS